MSGATTTVDDLAQKIGWAAQEYVKGAEMTRDPIFLLQIRRFVFFYAHMGLPSEFAFCGDCEGTFNHSPEVHELFVHKSKACDGCRDSAKMTDEDMVEADLGCFTWETEMVFYSREEAERHAIGRAYNYGSEASGKWRVYCVPAEGSLALVLDHKRRAWLDEHKAADR